MTAAQLRERLPDDAYSLDKSDVAFRRTFERDKKDLVSIGVPLQVKKFAYGDPFVDHYFIEPSVYAERDLRFQPDELAALRLATRQVRLPDSDKAFIKTGIPTEEEIRSIEAVFGHTTDDEVESEIGEVPFDKRVSLLASASAKRMAVRYSYRRADGLVSSREVEPWRLSFTRGHWYLVGWDRNRKAERSYRVDRIRGSITEIDRSTHPVGEGTDLSAMKPWDFGIGEPVEVKVRVEAILACWAAQVAGTQGELQPDGSSVLTLMVVNKSALRSFVLDMLDHAEVLEPQWLRDEFVAWLEALVSTPLR